jgi:hypothetical protein
LTAFKIFWLICKWCSLFYVFGEVNFVTARARLCVYFCVCGCVCVYFCVCGYDRDGICFSERFFFVCKIIGKKVVEKTNECGVQIFND